MFAVVWFKDGKFVDGASAEANKPCHIEMPAGAKEYILPGDSLRMRVEQPMSAVREALLMLREARREGW
jgi:hypothetical protein